MLECWGRIAILTETRMVILVENARSGGELLSGGELPFWEIIVILGENSQPGGVGRCPIGYFLFGLVFSVDSCSVKFLFG